MTIPYERTRAVVQTRELLKRLLDPKATPRVPRWLRGQAETLLRHYPTFADIERVHRDVPDLFGPAPPFSRLSGTTTVQGVIDGTKED